jgi:hypothetical protein
MAKNVKGNTAKSMNIGKGRAKALRGERPKSTRQIKDPAIRYMEEHRGELGKDYKLNY